MNLPTKILKYLPFILVAVFICVIPLSAAPSMETGEIYSFQFKTIDGQDTSLAAYKGKAILIVNTASKCEFA